MGFLYFAEQKIDIAVVEVGLGGRLDATNVIHPLVSVITSISYDHMDILGNTLKEIAFEKGGIIKPGVPVVSSPQAEEAAKVLEELARKRNAPYYPFFAGQIRERFSSLREQRFDFRYGEKAYENIGIHLPGRHQMLNAACALTCITVLKELGFGIDDSAVRSGMDTTVWPGRLEMIREKPAVILDGAHNPSGAQTLADAVRLYFPGKKIHLILGVFRDKDVDGVVKILCSVAAEVTATMSDGPRATNASELAEIVRKYHSRVEIRPDLREAITAVMGRLAEEGTDDDILVISGSLHLIGEARTILLENLYGWSQWNH